MLNIRDLQKQYATETGPVDALKGVTLQIEPGEFFTLLGPSGCGKSTMLRSVAGLETPNAGEIVIGERTVFSSEERINVQLGPQGRGDGLSVIRHLAPHDRLRECRLPSPPRQEQGLKDRCRADGDARTGAC